MKKLLSAIAVLAVLCLMAAGVVRAQDVAKRGKSL